MFVRKQVPKDVVAIAQKSDGKQIEINFDEVNGKMQVYEYAVLVTSLSDEIISITQHYRDRADSENVFD